MSLFETLRGDRVAEADTADETDEEAADTPESDDGAEESGALEVEVESEETASDRLRMLRHDEIASRLDGGATGRIVLRDDGDTVAIVGDDAEIEEIRDGLLREDVTFEWQRLTVDDPLEADVEALTGLFSDMSMKRLKELAPALEEEVDRKLEAAERPALEESDEQTDEEAKTSNDQQ